MNYTKRVILYPYRMGSRSCKKLAQRLTETGQKVLRVRANGKYRPRSTDVIINWGSTTIPVWGAWEEQVNNHPNFVSNSVSKTISLQKMLEAGVSVPEFTADKQVASGWDKIVARTLTRSCGGKGIVICSKDDLVDAPLYTKFIDKDSEYRVHIFNGEMIDYSKKITRGEKKDVCSHDNGYEFVRNIKILDENVELAKKAVKALSLDFGAVDIIRKDGISYVLEVNTACGMEETTLNAYANAITKYATTS